MPVTATDEQELAKALDNVANLGDTSDPSTNNTQHSDSASGGSNGQYPPIIMPNSPVAPAPSTDDSQTTNDIDSPSSPPVEDDAPSVTHASSGTGPLADIKNEALKELRPLVDKLNVEPQEKFDTYLLLIRSTDDTSLIQPAHDAAKEIADEGRRAEALLEIIKEIDYLSQQKKS